jgi:beta-lactamase superfamily II metal-dependent hydrolase
MINVGQGDGLLVISPDGFTMMVDAGDEPTYNHIDDYLQEEGVSQLDYTLVSHQHADHMGAMDLVLRDHLEIGVAYDGGGFASTQAYRDYITAASDRRQTVEVGNRLDLGPQLEVQVLHADVGDRDNENNNSVVVRLTYGSFHLLLGGDCESELCESAFDPGPIDVYKVHHHGSSDSSSQRLLDQMQPSDALISVGLGNDYGHPSGSTLSKLSEMGIHTWRTDEVGDVVVRADGSGFTVAPH